MTMPHTQLVRNWFVDLSPEKQRVLRPKFILIDALPENHIVCPECKGLPENSQSFNDEDECFVCLNEKTIWVEVSDYACPGCGEKEFFADVAVPIFSSFCPQCDFD
jgi:hypothetical protein